MTRDERRARHVVKCIDTVTSYAIRRNTYRRRCFRVPAHVVYAARVVREERVDIAALEVVLDHLTRCLPPPPVRVGASCWELGGHIGTWISRNQDAIERIRRLA